jgi:hypothetical protein
MANVFCEVNLAPKITEELQQMTMGSDDDWLQL